MNIELIKNFELIKSSSLLDNPDNKIYFGKKENMVSVDKPFATKSFNDHLDGYIKGDRIYGKLSKSQIEEKRIEWLDMYSFMGGFKKIKEIPFWMKTYNGSINGKKTSMKRFEIQSMKGIPNNCGNTMKISSSGTTKHTYDDYILPDSFGMNDHIKIKHNVFWDKKLECFLWFYLKIKKNA